MKINETAARVGLSRRAVKLYEEKGLLRVSRDANGYRNYTEEDVRILKEIFVYRKLGIGIADIRKLLNGTDNGLLKHIYEEKKNALDTEQAELDALKHYIEDGDVDAICRTVDYKTIGLAMQDMVPGFYGYYFMKHFEPYLQIRITTQEQLEAYDTILNFWDNVTLRPPLFTWFMSFLMLRILPRPSLDKIVAQMDRQLQMYLHPTEEEYHALKEKVRKNVRMRNGLLKYHPALISQRRFMRRLQDCGYNDIFIPAMTRLSPAYREYHEALTQINERICADLGLYYDSHYNLIMKKKESNDENFTG